MDGDQVRTVVGHGFGLVGMTVSLRWIYGKYLGLPPRPAWVRGAVGAVLWLVLVKVVGALW